MRQLCLSLGLVAAALLAGPALAEPVTIGSLQVIEPWARATPPGAPTGAGYLSIANTGDAPDRLVAAQSPAAEGVEIHEMRVSDGVMVMRELAGGLEIPAGGTVTLAPGGAHLMFMGLKEPFRNGATVPVTLTFAEAGSVEVVLPVAPIGAPGPTPAAGHGGKAS